MICSYRTHQKPKVG